jgi:hypothetical protein
MPVGAAIDVRSAACTRSSAIASAVGYRPSGAFAKLRCSSITTTGGSARSQASSITTGS